MPTPARLRSGREIRAVFDARNAMGTATLVVHGRPSDPTHECRATVVAGRRVGGAVQRNRAKRRIRAALQAADLPPGMDLVVTAKPPAVTAAFADVRKDLERALSRVHVRAAAA
ncbi:ribonuclease P protein component [Euzebya rosea]|uniref:ribonuclease P protein component n=1 Tax=Euzebya rosea TaxID=2052804 RepID=UPI000D3E109A|nr:ribonuclease P protein component [Euzebya rosea]